MVEFVVSAWHAPSVSMQTKAIHKLRIVVARLFLQKTYDTAKCAKPPPLWLLVNPLYQRILGSFSCCRFGVVH